MASGKKQYMINTISYGKSFVERASLFELVSKDVRARTETNPKNHMDMQPGVLDSTARRNEIQEFFRHLGRTDSGLKVPDSSGDSTKTLQQHPVDPIRTLSNRLWAPKGSGENLSLIYCSGAMSLEAEKDAYNSLPFDIVFSDDVVKTGDGILPDSVEDLMTTWRDSKNSSVVVSGLFPVYQENIKLIPVESTFMQYYLALTGMTPEDMAKADEMLSDPQMADVAEKYKLGSKYQKEGAVYIWNLMRDYISAQTRSTKGSYVAYHDYSTYVNVPFKPIEARDMSFGGASAHAYGSSEYNFYALLYEVYSAHCDELLLPCMLLQSAAETVGGDPEVMKIANDNISLGGAIKPATCGNVYGKKKKRSADAAESMALSSLYWNEFGTVLSKAAKSAVRRAKAKASNPAEIDWKAEDEITQQVLRNILNNSPAAGYAAARMKNLVFSGDYGSIIADLDSQRENYPMYAEISFTADHFAQFSDHVNDAGLMTDLIDSLIASEPGNSQLIQDIPNNKKPALGFETPIFESTPTTTLTQRVDGGIALGQKQVIAARGRRVFDVETWLYKVLNNQQDTSAMTGRLHAHASSIAGGSMSNSLEKQIKTIIALGKIKDMVADYVRKYSQVLNGEPAYSETVVYQVTKKLLTPTSGQPGGGKVVQNFWFANSSDITNIKFHDTQVKYGKEYIYEIFAHTLVIGTRYDVGNNSISMDKIYKTGDALSLAIKQGDQQLKTLTFQDAPYSQAAWYTPDLKIVKTRIYGQHVLMYDSAPIPPEVEFVPYKDNNHMLLLIMKGAVGRQHLPTVRINSDYAAYGPKFDQTEGAAIERQRMYQSHEILPGENLLYESDDRPEYFEVYRSTVAPYSYTDFDGKLIYTVATKIPSEKTISRVPKFADSATMKEIITPNKKYYYTVRQVDPHGNFSNPSPVFEVEIVDQDGTVYPLIKEYQFKDPIPKTNRKYFNKHIKIAPSVQQVLINTNGKSSAFEAANGSIQLGVADNNIWGKNYKVRITSTTTGKSADLDIHFNQKHTKTLAEIEGTDVIDEETGVRSSTKDASSNAQTSAGLKGAGNMVRSTKPK